MSLASKHFGPAAFEGESDSTSLHLLRETAALLCRLPLEEALPLSLRTAARLVGASATALLHLQGSRPVLHTFPSRQLALEPDSHRLFAICSRTREPARSEVNLRLRDGRQADRGLAIPLVGHRQTLGALLAFTTRGNDFTEQQEDLLGLLACQLAQAVEGAQLTEEAARRELTLKGLYSIGKALTATENSQGFLQVIAETALSVLDADLVVLYEYLKGTGDVRVPPIYVGSPQSPEVLKERGAVISHRDSTVFKVLRSRAPIYAPDARKDWIERGFVSLQSPEDRSFLKREGVVSSAGIPLRLDGEALGVLFVNYRSPQVFDAEQRERIELVASQGALGISLSRHLERSRRYAENLSILTEVGNRLSSAVTLKTDEILALVHDEVGRLLKAANCYILFYDEEKDTYSFPFRTGEQEKLEILSAADLRQSLAAYVIRKRQPILVDEKGYAELVRSGEAKLLGLPSKVWLGAPMAARGRVLGMIAVQDYSNPDAYDPDDLNLLAALANQAAIAIDNARLLQKLELELREQTGLQHSTDEHVSQYQDLRYILRAILERAVTILDSDGGLILLRDPEPEMIRVAVTCNWPELQNRRLQFWQALAGTVAARGRAQLNNDYQRWPKKAPLFSRQENREKIGSLMGVPVKVDGEVLGVVVLTSTPERRRIYTQSDLDFLDQLAAPVVIAISNARRISFQRALVDNSPYPVIGANTSGILTTFNAAAERLTGYSRQEILHRDVGDLYWNGVLEAASIGKKLKELGGNVQVESAVKSKSGDKIPVLLSVAALTDEQGTSLGSIAVLEDLRIAALKGINARLLGAIEKIDRPQELRELIDTIEHEAVGLFRADAGCLFLPAGDLFSARSNRYAPNRQLRGLVLRRDSVPVQKLLGCKAPGLVLYRRDKIVPLLDNRGQSCLLILITSGDQVQGILALESTGERNFRFEEEVVRIFAARSAAALKRVELARGRLRVEETLIRSGGTIAAAQVGRMVIHEIKNSLSSLFWTLNEIQQITTQHGAPSKLKKKFDVADTEIERLRDLAERLRDFSSNKLKPRKTRAFLNDILVRTVEVLDSSIRRRGLTHRLDLDPALGQAAEKGKATFLLVDQAQLSQVVINLTLNALEASSEGDRLLFTTKLEGDRALLQLADTGCGMTRAQRKRLFDPDFSTKPGGTGLGLVISKLIVEDNHSGRISIQSRAGRGTTISLSLPILKERTKTHAERSDTEATPATAKVIAPGGRPARRRG